MAKRTKGKGRKTGKGRKPKKAPKSKGMPEKVLVHKAKRLGKTVGGRKIIALVKRMY
jgi:hypothetical protein